MRWRCRPMPSVRFTVSLCGARTLRSRTWFTSLRAAYGSRRFDSRLRKTARPLFSSLIKSLVAVRRRSKRPTLCKFSEFMCWCAGPYADSLEDEDGCST
jgi:hypothetical protein